MTNTANKDSFFQNNFDFFRLCFAIFVIITHAYPLLGFPEKDWLSNLTSGQILFSYIGVRGFFVISGFLIFQSLVHSKTFKEFIFKRILRLFPALIMVLFLSAFILAPILSSDNITGYFTSLAPFKYFISNVQLFYHKIIWCIPGLFTENPICAVNGSLWTISYEFFFYIILGLTFFLSKKIRFVTIIGIFISLLAMRYTIYDSLHLADKILYPSTFKAHSLIELGLYFSAGSILSMIKFYKLKKSRLAMISLTSFTLIVLSLYFNIYEFFKYILFPIFLISTAYLPIRLFVNIRKIGDFSYGIYLYAFVIQQTLITLFDLNVLQLQIYATLVSIVFGALSWHLLEKHALNLKKKLHPLELPTTPEGK